MTIDPLVSLLVGAFGAALLGLFGAWVQFGREHARWIREQRIDAYKTFLRVTEMMWPAQSPDRTVWRAHMDDMSAALGEVTLVGPDLVTTAAADYLDAVLGFASVQRKVNGVEDGKPRPRLEPHLRLLAARTNAARDALVTAARAPLKIRN